MSLRPFQFAKIVAATIAALAIAGCATYPGAPSGYGYSQQSTIYTQPAYPAASYAPPSGYYESREYVRPFDAQPLQPFYPQPYGYAPAYPNSGIVIYGGNGGRRGDDFDRDHRHDDRGHDERRHDDHRGDGGWHGGPRHDGGPHADPRMGFGEHGQNHGPVQPNVAQRPAAVPPAPPVPPQVRVQPPGVPAHPVQPQAPGPRRDRD